MTDLTPLLTSEEVAAYLKVSPRTLDWWAGQHQGPPYALVGRSRRYRREDVDAWLSTQPKGGHRENAG